jgi:hypothetical protein
MAGHALVGCVSAVMGGGKCGPGALSGAAGSFAGPILKGLGFQRNLVAHAVIGGLASVAAGGKFANGAVTAAFGYLFNEAALLTKRDWTGDHTALFIWNDGDPVLYDPAGKGYSGTGDPGDYGSSGTFTGNSASIEAFKQFYKDQGYEVEVNWLNTSKEDDRLMVDWIEKDAGATYFMCTIKTSQCLQQVPSMKDLDTKFLPNSLKNAVQKYKLPEP